MIKYSLVRSLEQALAAKDKKVKRLEGRNTELTHALSFMTNALDREESEETADWEITDIRWRERIDQLQAIAGNLTQLDERIHASRKLLAELSGLIFQYNSSPDATAGKLLERMRTAKTGGDDANQD